MFKQYKTLQLTEQNISTAGLTKLLFYIYLLCCLVYVVVFCLRNKKTDVSCTLADCQSIVDGVDGGAPKSYFTEDAKMASQPCEYSQNSVQNPNS